MISEFKKDRSETRPEHFEREEKWGNTFQFKLATNKQSFITGYHIHTMCLFASITRILCKNVHMFFVTKNVSKCAVLHSPFKIFMYPSLYIFHLHFTNFLHITIHKMYACIKLKATPCCTIFFCIGRQQFYNWLSGKRKWRMYPEMF